MYNPAYLGADCGSITVYLGVGEYVVRVDLESVGVHVVSQFHVTLAEGLVSILLLLLQHFCALFYEEKCYNLSMDN